MKAIVETYVNGLFIKSGYENNGISYRYEIYKGDIMVKTEGGFKNLVESTNKAEKFAFQNVSSNEEILIPIIEDYDFTVTERNNERYLKLKSYSKSMTIEIFDNEHEPYEKRCMVTEPQNMISRILEFTSSCLIYRLIELGYNLISCSDRCGLIKMVGNNVVIYVNPSTDIPGFI